MSESINTEIYSSNVFLGKPIDFDNNNVIKTNQNLKNKHQNTDQEISAVTREELSKCCHFWLDIGDQISYCGKEYRIVDMNIYLMRGPVILIRPLGSNNSIPLKELYRDRGDFYKINVNCVVFVGDDYIEFN